jgi:hypothetical protein
MLHTASEKDLAVDGKIILKCDIRNQDGRAWIKLMWPKIETSWRTIVKTVMKLRGSTKPRESLDLLSNYHLLKKDQALQTS